MPRKPAAAGPGLLPACQPAAPGGAQASPFLRLRRHRRAKRRGPLRKRRRACAKPRCFVGRSQGKAPPAGPVRSGLGSEPEISASESARAGAGPISSPSSESSRARTSPGHVRVFDARAAGSEPPDVAAKPRGFDLPAAAGCRHGFRAGPTGAGPTSEWGLNLAGPPRGPRGRPLLRCASMVTQPPPIPRSDSE